MFSGMGTGGVPGIDGRMISVKLTTVTFTRSAPLSNLTKASSRHATHGLKSVLLTPGGPCVPLTPGGPCGPGGPCAPVLLSLSLSFLSSNLLSCFASPNSTELTKKPSKGPVLHSYFLSLVL
jgi:hypothetical protein